jgi:hypothetical protein
MTSSLPESIDDLYRYTPISFTTSDKVTPNTLWSKLNECDKCIFFRNMVAKSLIATDFNNENSDVKTIFVPRDRVDGNAHSSFEYNTITPHKFISSLTIPGQFFIMPETSPINMKVQNKFKEYISVNIKEIADGGHAFIQSLNRLWIVIVPNILCTNGVIHLVEEVYAWD